MLGGLAEVVRRIGATAPLRYLTEDEIANGLNVEAYRYRELVNANHNRAAVFAQTS